MYKNGDVSIIFVLDFRIQCVCFENKSNSVTRVVKCCEEKAERCERWPFLVGDHMVSRGGREEPCRDALMFIGERTRQLVSVAGEDRVEEYHKGT